MKKEPLERTCIEVVNRLSTILLALLLLTSCSDGNGSMSYDEVKKMVIDTIQTEEGKKAIRQLLEDPNFRDLVVLEHNDVQSAIENTLLSEKAEDFWKKTFEDPKFKESIAKSMKEQQTGIMKELMNDASYQKQLINFFSQAEMKKELESIMKSATVREELEKVVMETIENPLLQTKWQELIKKSGETSGDDKSSDGKSEEKGDKSK